MHMNSSTNFTYHFVLFVIVTIRWSAIWFTWLFCWFNLSFFSFLKHKIVGGKIETIWFVIVLNVCIFESDIFHILHFIMNNLCFFFFYFDYCTTLFVLSNRDIYVIILYLTKWKREQPRKKKQWKPVNFLIFNLFYNVSCFGWLNAHRSMLQMQAQMPLDHKITVRKSWSELCC